MILHACNQHFLRKHCRKNSVALALLALLAAGFYLPRLMMEQYATFTRPDGHYQIVVMRKKNLLGVMPGQASDSPGVIRLYNQRGELMREMDVEMVQLVEKVDWQEQNLSIKLIVDWSLPD